MEILLVPALGGLLALDGTSVGQFMLSRPLIAGAVVGWAVGAPGLGLLIGGVLELYFIVSFPTGGASFPESATAAAVAVACAAAVQGPGTVPLAVALGLVWGQVGAWTITALRHVNVHLVSEPEDPTHPLSRVVWGHLGSIALDFLRGVAVTAAGVWVGLRALPPLVERWPLSPQASAGVVWLGAAVSAGILLRDLGGVRRRGLVLAAGLVLGLIGGRLL